MSDMHSDVVIVGAGPIGQCIAIGLAQFDLSVCLVDGQDISAQSASTQQRMLTKEFSPRVSAISLASQRVFERLGVWQHIMRKAEYTNMHVWEDQAFGEIQFDDPQHKSLGHIVENDVLVSAGLSKIASLPNVSLIQSDRLESIEQAGDMQRVGFNKHAPCYAKLVIGADGINSKVRELAGFKQTFWDYDQTALVGTVRTEHAHQFCARQAFSANGPLAFLPLSDPHHCSIVWSQDTAYAERLANMAKQDFEKALQVAINNTLGACELVGELGQFSLRMQYARQWLTDGIVLAGDAAHSIHPLAGQGMNLGILDAAALVQLIEQALQTKRAFHTADALGHYQRWRKAEALKMIATMQAFRQGFAGNNPLKKLIRNAGLWTANRVPMCKSFFIQQAIGGSANLPRLAKL